MRPVRVRPQGQAVVLLRPAPLLGLLSSHRCYASLACTPASRMALMDKEVLHLLIRRKHHDRRLPHNGIRTVWSGPSDGGMCDACDTVLTKNQLLMEAVTLDLGRRPFQMHV